MLVDTVLLRFDNKIYLIYKSVQKTKNWILVAFLKIFPVNFYDI